MAVSYDSIQVANVRNPAFGAAGNGAADDTEAVTGARNSVSAGGTVYFPPGVYRVAADIIFPQNVTLMFSNGASLAIDAGRTVTINGPLEAGLHRIFGGGGSVAGLALQEKVFPQWWGAAANIPSDQTAAFQAALNTGRPVYVTKGVYAIQSSLYALNSEAITLIGEQGTVLDGTSSNSQTLIRMGGQRAGSAPLAAKAVKGTSVLSSGLAAAAGDVLLVSSTEAWNGPYNKGEMVEVSAVSGSSITLKTPLYDDYDAATTRVFRLAMPKVRVEQIIIRRNSNQAGLWIDCARDVTLRRCAITGARERCFYLSYVYGAIVEDNEASDFWYPNSGTSYGLVIASSQNVIERENTFTGGRHAISHGGWEPVRNIVVEHNVLDNHHPSGQPALDFHGNSEFVTVQGNTIRNGLIFLGRNIRIAGNYCYGENRSAIHYWPNLSGDYCIIEDNVIDTENASNPNAYGISFLGFAPNITIGRLRVAGNRIRTKMRSISIEPYTSVQTGIVIDKLELAENDVSSADLYSLIVYRSGAAKIHIGSLRVTGGTYVAYGHSLLFDVDPASGSAVFQGASIAAAASGSAAVAGTAGFNYAEFTGCVFSGGAASAGSTFNNAGTLKITDSTFLNCPVPHNVSVTGDFYEKGNLFSNSPGFAVSAARVLVDSFASGGAVGRGTSAPVSGTWKQGDRVWNTSPSLNRNISEWVCIAGGSPSVWTAQGTGFGTTAQRPVLGPKDAGYGYFDSTAGKTLIWNGGAWV